MLKVLNGGNMKKQADTTNQQGFAVVAVVAIVLIIAVIGFAGYRIFMSDESGSSPASIDSGSQSQQENTEVANEPAAHLSYQYQATLTDVTDAATLEGIKFAGDSDGMAYATIEGGMYKLYASFTNLPELPENLFYEGWIVGGAEGIVSTGELKLVNGIFINEFTDERNMTDSKRYVLTLEPRDGDPAPAPGHVVEGDFTNKAN